MCSRGIEFVSISTICRLEFGTEQYGIFYHFITHNYNKSKLLYICDVLNVLNCDVWSSYLSTIDETYISNNSVALMNETSLWSLQNYNAYFLSYQCCFIF